MKTSPPLKLLISFLLFFYAANLTYAQKNYDINISFSGAKIDPAKLATYFYTGYNMNKLNKNASNQFHAKEKSFLDFPVLEFYYYSSTNSPSIHSFFVEKKQTSIHLYYDSLTDKISVQKKSGLLSFEDAGQPKFEASSKDEIAASNLYYKKNENDIVSGDSAALSQLDRLYKAIWDKKLEVLKTTPPSKYSLWFFMNEIAGKKTYPASYLLSLYEQYLQPTYKNTFEGKYIENKQDENRLAINTEAPGRDISFEDLSGKNYTLNAFGDKPVLITIWATWCVPCVAEIPKLKALYTKYQDKLAMVSFSADYDESKLRNYVAANKLPWINVYDRSDFCHIYGLDLAIPQVYLIDKNGLIAYSRLKMEDIELDKLESFIENHVSE